jgi:hypothetical protein
MELWIGKGIERGKTRFGQEVTIEPRRNLGGSRQVKDLL